MCRPSELPAADPPFFGTEAPACLLGVAAGEPRRPRACGVEPAAAGGLLPAFMRLGVACAAGWMAAAALLFRVLATIARQLQGGPGRLRAAERDQQEVSR